MSARRYSLGPQRPVLRRGSPPAGACPICGDPFAADDYVWCRACIRRAASGAARYFVEGSSRFAHFSGEDLEDVIRRQASRWQHRFKRRLRRRRWPNLTTPQETRTATSIGA